MNFDLLDALPIALLEKLQRVKQRVNTLIEVPPTEKQQTVRRLASRWRRPGLFQIPRAGQELHRDTPDSLAVICKPKAVGINVSSTLNNASQERT